METLNLLIEKLRLFKQKDYADLLNDPALKESIIKDITKNQIIKDFLDNFSLSIKGWARSNRFLFKKLATPLFVLFQTYSVNFKGVEVCGDEDSKNLEYFFWNIESLNATLKMLKVIRKHYQETNNLLL